MAGLLPAGQCPAGGQTAVSPAAATKSGVRRWAHRLLQRGHSASSMPVTPLSNGDFQAAVGDGQLKRPANVSNAAGPCLPPKTCTARLKPVPPPRTSSCLSSNSIAGADGGNSSAPSHQDLLIHPPPSAAALQMMAAAAAAAAQEMPIKSVRFGQQQQQQQQQQSDPAGSIALGGQQREQQESALAEATIGLEMAANLALAFARDVRRERQMQLAEVAATAPPAPSPAAAPSVAATASTRQRQQHPPQDPVKQEVTLSEFYQLLQFVTHHHQASGKPAGQAAHQQPTSKDPHHHHHHHLPPPHPPQSSALKPSPASQQFPPGYLTARSFRQNRKIHHQTVTAEPPSPVATRRSHSVEVNHHDVVAAAAAVANDAATAASHQQSASQLKTQSLPRTVRPGSQGSTLAGSVQAAFVPSTDSAAPATPSHHHHHHHHHQQQQQHHPPPVRHWAEILALISQVLSRADQYQAPQPPQQRHQQQQAGTCSKRPAGGGAGRKPPPTLPAASSGGGGGSVSDSEEAYHRRQLASAVRVAESGRPYETLKNPTRPSSRASSVADGHGAGGGGHQSYLASLSHRLQIEQYIVKTLTHLTKENGGGKSCQDDGPAGYFESWGSPERTSKGGNGRPSTPNSNLGLERALLRLDQRRTERHPRIYQHHHWRITPSECNALFLCKVLPGWMDGPLLLAGCRK